MPIVFAQPEAYDPGTYQAYGRLQQEIANRSALGHGGGYGGGGGQAVQPQDHYSGGGGGGAPPERADASLYAEISQTQLNQREQMRLSNLQNQLSSVDEAPNLTPEERNDLKLQLQTSINPLQQRQIAAHTAQQKAHTAQLEQQMALASAHEVRNVANFANAGVQREYFHPSVLADATSAIDQEFPDLARQAADGVPEAERYRQQMIESRTRTLGGSTHFIFGPDGKLIKNDLPQRQQREPMVTPEVVRKTYSDASREVRDELHAYQRDYRAARTAEERNAIHIPSWMNDRQGNIVDFMEGAFAPGGADRERMMQREVDRRARSLLGHYQRQEPSQSTGGNSRATPTPTGDTANPQAPPSATPPPAGVDPAQVAALQQVLGGFAGSTPGQLPVRPSGPVNQHTQQGPQTAAAANEQLRAEAVQRLMNNPPYRLAPNGTLSRAQAEAYLSTSGGAEFLDALRRRL